MKDSLIGAAPVRRLRIGRVGLVAGFALVGAVAIVLLNEAVSPVEDLSLVRVAHPVQMLVPAPPSLQGLREWYVDSEIQGECECERPYDAVTHVANPEIVCKCPRSYVPTAVELADYDEEEQSEEDPEEMEYEDGCVCVLGPEKFPNSENYKETTCTCPLEDDVWDYDMHPPYTEGEDA